MKTSTALCALTSALLATSIASADSTTSTTKHLPTAHVAASVGMNSPAGFAGVEADYRISRYFSAGLAGGYGLWGYRISPTAKLEVPMSASTGIFLEGALSLNTGGDGYTEVNGMRQSFEMEMVPAASVAFGGRVHRWGPFWTGARVGFSFALRKDAYTVMGGEPTTALTQTLIDAAAPGGMLVSWMAGAAF